MVTAEGRLESDNVRLDVLSELGPVPDGQTIITHMLQPCKEFCLLLTRLDLCFECRVTPDILAERYQLLGHAELGQPLVSTVHNCLLLDRSHVNHLAGQLLSIVDSVGHMDTAVRAKAQAAPRDDKLLTEKLSNAS